MPYVRTKTNYKRLFGTAFLLGTLGEVSVIVGGIFFYRKYNHDDGKSYEFLWCVLFCSKTTFLSLAEFRNQMLRDYPQAMEVVHDIAGTYKRMIDATFTEETQAKILNFMPSFGSNKTSSNQDK